MPSIPGLSGAAGGFNSLMEGLRGGAGGAGGAAGAGAGGDNSALGMAGAGFSSALQGALSGDTGAVMSQLDQLKSTDPTKVGQGGALDKAAKAADGRGFAAAGTNSVGDLVGSLSKAVESRLTNTEAAKKASEESIQTLVTGGDIDLHNVILASERAGLELKLTMTLRNKLIEAYQEVMRIPV